MIVINDKDVCPCQTEIYANFNYIQSNLLLSQDK